MQNEILNKYNKPVPRYTSYPPANYFVPFDNQQYLQAVEQSNNAADNNISFYIHIPFCKQLCNYCGCNSYAMPSAEVVTDYIAALHKEIDLQISHIDKDRKISQIHYGGGTPTCLPADEIKRLNEHLLRNFNTIAEPEIAIECHPGVMTKEYWLQLVDCGFNRYSIGIQDFDCSVLKMVNRLPSLLPLSDIFEILRKVGATINLDFIYGLPGQTSASFADAISKAITLHPDRLVTFSYAHVPFFNKRQLILEKYGLPPIELKNKMFEVAEELLHLAGYKSIGLDHYVLPSDELYMALQQHKLHRNFQGYCTRKTTGQVYAFGVTGISQLESAYAQNTKDIKQYIYALSSGSLCVAKGYSLSREEQVTRAVIETLMCNYHIEWADLSQRLNLPVSELLAMTAYDKSKLDEFASDGLIEYDADHLSMTSEGSPFVRNVAASFDRLMINTTKQFSKPI